MKTRTPLAPLLVIILLIGCLLRVTNLGALGIWGDEAFSIVISQMRLARLMEATREVHPPLFRVLFHFWMLGVGTSEFAARYFALIPGMMLIPATYAVTRRLLNAPAAIVAALLTAISPFAVYYSQEARMYSQVALAATVSVYTFLRLLEQPDRASSSLFPLQSRWLALYLAATLAGMYTHFYMFFVMAAQSIYALWHWRKNRRALVSWIAVQIALAALYLPWVFAQFGHLAGKASRRWEAWGPEGMADVWLKTLVSFSLGETRSPNTQGLALPMIVVACAGLVVVLARRRWLPARHAAFAAIYLIAPMLIAWAVGPLMPHYYERYLLPILPAFAALTAAGIAGLWLARKAIAAGALALVIVAQVPALANLNRSPEFDKGNYREIMATIAANAKPDDGLLLLNPEQDVLYAYYGKNNPLPVYWFPPAGGWESAQNQRQMTKIEKNRQRLWLILFGNARYWDYGNHLQDWLDQHAFRTFHADYVDGALELYVLGDIQPDTPAAADFGGMIRLTGFGVSSASVAPGDTIQVALAWKALARPDQDYTLFTHVVDAQQQIVGQFDGQPGAGTHPTSQWQPGETSVERVAITINPDTAPGTYWLQVGWYDLATLTRLTATDSSGKPSGDHMILIPITVR